MQKLKRFVVFLGICILLFPMVKVSAGKTKKAYITSTIKNCEIGDKFYVKLKGTKAVSYEILDETVATVNSKGKVKTKRAGKTKLVIGLVHDKFVHLPTRLVTAKRNKVNPEGSLWRDAIDATGQPIFMGKPEDLMQKMQELKAK